MISWNEVERLKREATELGRYSIHVCLVLSLVFSLAAVAIISKKDLTNYLWLDVAALGRSDAHRFVFQKPVALLGVFTYAAVVWP